MLEDFRLVIGNRCRQLQGVGETAVRGILKDLPTKFPELFDFFYGLNQKTSKMINIPLMIYSAA